MYAARVWWMLRFMGHDAVAVLDGGLARWAARRPSGPRRREHWRRRATLGAPRPRWRLDADDVMGIWRSARACWSIAHAEGRYRGVNETLDKVAATFPARRTTSSSSRTSTADKTFKSARRPPRAVAGAPRAHADPRDVVMYCGSGVTACHNLLALEHAGIQGVKIYPGSWRAGRGSRASEGDDRGLNPTNLPRAVLPTGHEDEPPFVPLHPGHRAGLRPHGAHALLVAQHDDLRAERVAVLLSAAELFSGATRIDAQIRRHNEVRTAD